MSDPNKSKGDAKDLLRTARKALEAAEVEMTKAQYAAERQARERDREQADWGIPGPRPPAYQIEPDPAPDALDLRPDPDTDLDQLEPIELPDEDGPLDQLVGLLLGLSRPLRRLSGQSEEELDGLPPRHSALEEASSRVQDLLMGGSSTLELREELRELALVQRFLSYLVRDISSEVQNRDFWHRNNPRQG